MQSLPGDIGFSEPVVDREHWVKNQMVTILKQKSKQPEHDKFLDADDESKCSAISFLKYLM